MDTGYWCIWLLSPGVRFFPMPGELFHLITENRLFILHRMTQVAFYIEGYRKGSGMLRKGLYDIIEIDYLDIESGRLSARQLSFYRRYFRELPDSIKLIGEST